MAKYLANEKVAKSLQWCNKSQHPKYSPLNILRNVFRTAYANAQPFPFEKEQKAQTHQWYKAE